MSPVLHALQFGAIMFVCVHVEFLFYVQVLVFTNMVAQWWCAIVYVVMRCFHSPERLWAVKLSILVYGLPLLVCVLELFHIEPAQHSATASADSFLINLFNRSYCNYVVCTVSLSESLWLMNDNEYNNKSKLLISTWSRYSYMGQWSSERTCM